PSASASGETSAPPSGVFSSERAERTSSSADFAPDVDDDAIWGVEEDVWVVKSSLALVGKSSRPGGKFVTSWGGGVGTTRAGSTGGKFVTSWDGLTVLDWAAFFRGRSRESSKRTCSRYSSNIRSPSRMTFPFLADSLTISMALASSETIL